MFASSAQEEKKSLGILSLLTGYGFLWEENRVRPPTELLRGSYTAGHERERERVTEVLMN